MTSFRPSAGSFRIVACAIAFVCLELLLAASSRAERLPLRVYTTADGLARDHINKIFPDSHGYIWFGTTEGLSRFDGYGFTNYGKEQGLPGRIVNDFIETGDGSFWVATNEGVCRFNPDPASPGGAPARRFVLYHLGTPANVDRVNVICEDHNGRIWCGTDAGLFRLDRAGAEPVISFVDIIRPRGTNDSLRVKTIIQDRQGSLWIGAYSGLYRIRPDGRTEVYAEPEGLEVSVLHDALLEDREGRIWIATGQVLQQLVPDPQPGRSAVAHVYSRKEGLDRYGVSVVIQSADGRIWTGSQGGGLLEMLHSPARGGLWFRTYTAASGLSDGVITALAEDRDGNLWIGTESGGAMKLAVSGLTTYGEADGLKATRIASIIEDRDGKVCVFGSEASTGGHILHRFDGERFLPIHIPLPAGWHVGWGWSQITFQDRAGEWWVPTEHGLIRFAKMPATELSAARPKAVYTMRDGLGADYVFRVYEDVRRDIWLSCLGDSQHVLSRWDRATETMHSYSPADGVFESAPTAFADDAAGNLWIGFYDGGLLRYCNGRFTRFTDNDGVPPGFVRTLYADRAGRLWVATSEGGAARIDDPNADRPHFVAYTTRNGLASNQATCVAEDRWGRIYIGTGHGIDRLDLGTGHIRHLATADGLANDFINACLVAHDGALWFGTLQGLSRFLPQTDRPSLPPRIVISGLRMAGVAYPVSELGATAIAGPALSAGENQVQVDYLGISLAPGAALRYQYRLEGADRDWSEPTEQRTVNYANLSPGRYRFLVRGMGADGTMSPTPAEISFRIRPPIWQSWWFIAAVGLAIAAIVYAIDRYRIARLIELERVRTRIATDLHDDIGSSLSQVSVLSEVIRRRVGDEPTVAEPLSMIATLSRDLVDSMNDIVWAINPRRDRLADLTHRMRRFASDAFTNREIAFTFDAPEQHDVRLEVDVRREVFLVFKESINNVVRHSGCTAATVDFRIQGHWLELSVTDNGRGFDPERVCDGNGLVNMRQRAERIGGSFTVAPGPGQGAAIKLRAPVRRRGWVRG